MVAVLNGSTPTNSAGAPSGSAFANLLRARHRPRAGADERLPVRSRLASAGGITRPAGTDDPTMAALFAMLVLTNSVTPDFLSPPPSSPNDTIADELSVSRTSRPTLPAPTFGSPRKSVRSPQASRSRSAPPRRKDALERPRRRSALPADCGRACTPCWSATSLRRAGLPGDHGWPARSRASTWTPAGTGRPDRADPYLGGPSTPWPARVMFVPTAFRRLNLSLSLRPPDAFAVIYRAEGTADIWSTAAAEPADRTDRLIGRTTARLLRNLQRPATTSHLVSQPGPRFGPCGSPWPCCATPAWWRGPGLARRCSTRPNSARRRPGRGVTGDDPRPSGSAGARSQVEHGLAVDLPRQHGGGGLADARERATPRDVHPQAPRLDQPHQGGQVGADRRGDEEGTQRLGRPDGGVGRERGRLAGTPADALHAAARRQQLQAATSCGPPTLSSTRSTGSSIWLSSVTT